MGEKAKVKKVLWTFYCEWGTFVGIFLGLAFSLMISGCGTKKEPTPPTITINEEDSADWTTVTVTFNNHYRDQHGPTYIVLQNPEELQAYKEQVEFLLKRLEETERRMNIHEPEVGYGAVP